MASDTDNFPTGLYVKKPHENAPDFIVAKLSFKRQDFLDWLREQDSEWVNVQIKESRAGEFYAVVDDWKPEKQDGETPPDEVKSEPPDNDFDDDIPF